MSNERFDSIWDAIEDTPEQAANMKIRARLLITLQRYVDRTGLTQAQAATLFGVTQPRISDLMRGKIGVFSVDTLINMTAAAGMRIEVQVSEAVP